MSALTLYPARAGTPGLGFQIMYLEGAGAAAPVMIEGGENVAVTRDGVGQYSLTWSVRPGTFAGVQTTLSVTAATSPFITWTDATLTLQVNLAAELAATQFLSITALFKQHNASG